MNRHRFHAANKKRWEAAARQWGEHADNRGIWRRCAREPGLVLCAKELEFLGDVLGQRICILGSGDNQVAFALAGLGALVTSVDISQNQLDIAEARSVSLGLDICFLRADVTDLSCIETGAFDVVYTGGHVAVWVADLATYYSEAVRILRPKGLFIVNEYHPFRRIWQESKDSMIVETGYFESGPFAHDFDDDVLRRVKGELRCYEFHWTIADYLNAVLKAGASLLFLDEFGETVSDWEGAPMDGLPEFLLIIARKSRA